MPTIHRAEPLAPAIVSAATQLGALGSWTTPAPDEITVAPALPNTATTLPTSATARTGPTCACAGFHSTGRTPNAVTAPAALECGAAPQPASAAAESAMTTTSLAAGITT